jgi:pyruvate/2-oxoglutarate dehydrogenase complex dihydrolipoamide dehydrogenase (E3) component
VRASRFSAINYGARVAIAESDRFGGTCVNVGCIPKKLFSYAAHFREDFEVARSFGWSADKPRFDWATLLANKNREIARLNGVYERLLREAGVTIHRGRATVRDAHTVEVDGKAYTARHILIATGGGRRCPRSRDASTPSPRTKCSSSSACRGARCWSAAAISQSSSHRSSTAWRRDDARVPGRAPAARLRRGPRDPSRRGDGEEGRAHSPASEPGRIEPDRTVVFADCTSEQYDLVMFATGRRPNTASLGSTARA